jgi:hypothetical protein
VRVKAKPRNELIVPFSVLNHRIRRPEDKTAQPALEYLDGLHGHGINHLLVELRVSVGRGMSVLNEKVGIVQIHWLIEAITPRVIIDDLEVLTDGPRQRAVLISQPK